MKNWKVKIDHCNYYPIKVCISFNKIINQNCVHSFLNMKFVFIEQFNEQVYLNFI
jgi:hypothetical protein